MVARASYQFERSFAGLVLGKNGKSLNQLRQLRGVHEVFLDRKTSHCTLRVIAVRQEYCDAVYKEAMRRINNYISSAQMSRFLIDIEDDSLDTAVLAPCTNKNNDSFVVGAGRKDYDEYVVSSFIRGSPCNSFDFQLNDNLSNGSSFMEFNNDNIVRSFQDALNLYKTASSDHQLHFHVSVGKMTFTVPSGSKERYLDRNSLTGSNGRNYLTEKSIGTYFNPNIGSHLLTSISKKLDLLDFNYVEDDCNGKVVVNFDEGASGWTNCSIELSKDHTENRNNNTKPGKLIKIVKHRKRLRNLSTLSTNQIDIGATLSSYKEKESELTEDERKAFRLCWDDWKEVDELIPGGGGNSSLENKVSVSCLKQVEESYMWVKEIPFSHNGEDTAELNVRMKKLNKKSRKFGLRENCVEFNLYFTHDRSNISGEDLTDEMMELKKWISSILE